MKEMRIENELWFKEFAIERMSDAVFWMGSDARFIYVNEVACHSLGYSKEELLSITVHDIDPWFPKERWSHHWSELKGKKTFTFESRHKVKDGRVFPVEITVNYVEFAGKEYNCAFARDITARRQTEKALEDSEKKYLDLYNNAPDGYHSLGPDGIILEVNEKWLKMFGYIKDEVIGKMNFKDILTENRVEFFQKSFNELKRKGTIDNIEQEIKRKDGTIVTVIINASAIYDENGNFIKSISIVRDSSERKNYEKMLVNASEEWRVTFDSMPYGVLLVDMDFNIQRANKYISNFCGISLKNMKGKNINELFIDEQSEESLKSHDKHIISLGAREYYDSRYKKYFIRYETPIPGEDGLTKALIIAMVDISEMKDKEKKLIGSRDAFLNMLKEIDFSYKELQDVHKNLIHSFVNAIDAKSPWTKGHSERVTGYSVSIARALGLRNQEIETLRIAALLHDIGKIGTYDVLLDKPGKLSKEEFDIVKKHPEHGEQILRPIKQFQHLLKIIRHHHERIDGKGYPDGIKNDEIPLLSRIITIADSYDSMTSDRPYRSAPPREYALSELKNCSGTQFDPLAAEAFLRVLGKTKYNA
jgi:PAS domain S-box-containing protein/putative nucleotidyltransferase with HDIG domain